MCEQACRTVRPAISLLIEAAAVPEDIVLRAVAVAVVAVGGCGAHVVQRVHANERRTLQCELTTYASGEAGASGSRNRRRAAGKKSLNYVLKKSST